MRYKRIPFVGRTPAGEMTKLDGLPSMENDMSKIARIPVSTRPMGWPGFASWLRATNPTGYKAIAMRLRGDYELQGLGIVAPTADPVATAAATPSLWDKLSSTVRDVLPQLVTAYSQKKILDAQIRRAELGQAPLDTAALADATSIKVGADPATRNTALLIAGGLGLVFLGSKLLGRR